MAAKKAHKPVMGEVCSGTLRPQDLLRMFADELQWVAPHGNSALVAKAKTTADAMDRIDSTDGPDLSSDIIRDLEDKLNEQSTDYLYFGASIGDSASFGWFPDMYSINELPSYQDTGEARDARYIGDFRVVSDHGNVTVWRRGGNGRITYVLGIV
jgi:hypothetical protein